MCPHTPQHAFLVSVLFLLLRAFEYIDSHSYHKAPRKLANWCFVEIFCYGDCGEYVDLSLFTGLSILVRAQVVQIVFEITLSVDPRSLKPIFRFSVG